MSREPRYVLAYLDAVHFRCVLLHESARHLQDYVAIDPSHIYLLGDQSAAKGYAMKFAKPSGSPPSVTPVLTGHQVGWAMYKPFKRFSFLGCQDSCINSTQKSSFNLRKGLANMAVDQMHEGIACSMTGS